MCQKIDTNSFLSRWIPHLKILLVAPMVILLATQDCRGMDETTRLLSGEDPAVNGRGNDSQMEVVIEGRSGDQLPQYDYVPVPVVEVDRALLQKVNNERAKGQMNAIIHYLSLIEKPGRLKGLKKIYQEEAKIKSVSIDTEKELSTFLFLRAWEALTNKPTLADYLNERQDQSDALIDILHHKLNEVAALREQSEGQNKLIGELLAMLKENRELQKDLLGEDLMQTTSSPKGRGAWNYIIPSLTFVAGGAVFGLLGHFGYLGHP